MKKLIFSLVLILLFFPICADEVWSRSVGGKKFTEALIYCSSLKENGVSGWRLPTTDELSGFNESSGYYWASDPADELNKDKQYDNDEDKAWFYNFFDKKKMKSFVSTRMHVICVRKKQEEVKPQVIVIDNTKDVRAANARAYDAEQRAEQERIERKQAEREAWNARIRAQEAEERARQAEKEKNAAIAIADDAKDAASKSEYEKQQAEQEREQAEKRARRNKAERDRAEKDARDRERYIQEHDLEHPYKISGISLIVVGAVVAAGGVTGFHVAAENKYDEYKKMSRLDKAQDAVDNGIGKESYMKNARNLRKEANTFRALEITSGVVGGAVLVTGIVLVTITTPKNFALTNISVEPSKNGFYASLGFGF